MTPRLLALAAQRITLLTLQSLACHLPGHKPKPAHLQVGERGELEALFHLRRLGYIVIERRWRSPDHNGDLDLVAWDHADDHPILCFIEIKTRSTRDLTPAASAIDEPKRNMLRRMAHSFLRTLARSHRHQLVPRFDVVSVYLDTPTPSCELLRDAFPVARDRFLRIWCLSSWREKTMTLLNAPTYNEGKENLKRNILLGSLGVFVLCVLVTLGGYIAGHGWFFSNLPAEHRVSTFFAALQARDYNKAFGIYNNDANWQQHPDQYKDYPESRFQEDWTTQDPIKGPVNSYKVNISRTDGEGTFGTGIIVAVTVNGSIRVFMYYLRKSGQLTWPAYHELQY